MDLKLFLNYLQKLDNYEKICHIFKIIDNKSIRKVNYLKIYVKNALN